MNSFSGVLSTACALLVSGCFATDHPARAMDDFEPGTAVDFIDRCELFYETRPHKNAKKTINPGLIRAAASLSSADVYRFTESLVPLTDRLLSDAVESYGDTLTVRSHEIVQGGYEGITSSSVVLRITLNDQTAYQSLSDLAARIGYLYVQDSTLVACENISAEGWLDTESYELSDTQDSQQFWNEKNAALFFGLMIGASNDPDDIGYTYYPEAGIFLTFVDSDQEKEMVNSLVEWVEGLSEGSIDIAAINKRLKIFFPHNDWDAYPEGESYQKALQSDAVLDDLNGYRKLYIQKLDAFINALDSG